MDLNLMKEETLQQILAETRKTTEETAKIAQAQQARVDLAYRAKVAAASSASEVDGLFKSWWASQWMEGVSTKQGMVERWFGTVLDDNRVHGVKLPLYKTSQSPNGSLTDDSVGLVAEPSTSTKAGRDDFARLPQFWCLEVAAEKRADGSHEIFAVQHIDPIEHVRSGEHLCWVLQKNTYTRRWQDDQYQYMQMQCHPAPGFGQWPQGTDRTGKTYSYIGNPKYAAGIGADGRITGISGLKPTCWNSHSSGVQLWRKRGAQYAGASGCLLMWQLAMIWLKYASKGNSNIIEGCSSYYNRFKAAVSEQGVQRILIPESNKGKLFVGSNICIGSKGENNWDSGATDIARVATITSIETVSVGGTAYMAVNVDNGGVTFNTVAGQTGIGTMPYSSGWNDDVMGRDGSKFNPKSGYEPGLIQGTEFQNGAYFIVCDEFWQWGTNENGDYTFTPYTCHDQSKISTSEITPDYTGHSDLTLVFPAGTEAGWQYVADFAIGADRGILWTIPDKSAGSGTGGKAGFYVSPATSGIRAAWFFNYLSGDGLCGLAARHSAYSTSDYDWLGAVGVPGLSG